MVFQAVENVHPGGLIGQRNFAEADQRDSYTARHQPRDQLACIRPGARHGIRCDQNVHVASRSAPHAAVNAASSLLRSTILVRIEGEAEDFLGPLEPETVWAIRALYDPGPGTSQAKISQTVENASRIPAKAEVNGGIRRYPGGRGSLRSSRHKNWCCAPPIRNARSVPLESRRSDQPRSVSEVRSSDSCDTRLSSFR